MRRRNQMRATQAEVIDDSHAERAAFDRIRSGPDFVEQHKRGERHVAVHQHHVRDVR